MEKIKRTPTKPFWQYAIPTAVAFGAIILLVKDGATGAQGLSFALALAIGWWFRHYELHKL